MTPLLVLALLTGIALLSMATPLMAAAPGAPGPAQPLETRVLHSTFRLSPRLLSGAAPEGDEAFAELRRLGVRTVVSVDGTRPDVEAAKRHGLRYVHLPIGYDKVPAHRWPELIAAARGDTNGAVYLHCHHGRHRGPAALAVVCLATEGWSQEQALAWMKQAGTAAEYEGLYQSVRNFRPPPPGQIPSPDRLPETAQTSSLVDLMVEIDGHFDALKAAQASSWSRAEPGRDPAWMQAATLLLEAYREVERLPDTAGRPPDYREHLTRGCEASKSLADALRRNPLDPAGARSALTDLTSSCKACHQAHRN